MNAPRLNNLRKEHLAGVRDFLSAFGNCFHYWQIKKQGGTWKLLSSPVIRDKHILASPLKVKAFRQIHFQPDPSRWTEVSMRIEI